MGVNKVILLGNLGKDPELRYTPNQTAVGTFSLATGERRKDASGQWVDHTEWHNIVTFGKTAENCSNYLKKGRQAYIEGRIQTRKYQDKQGQDRWKTEIIADTVQFVGGREAGTGSGRGMANNVTMEESAPPPMPNLPTADAIAAGAGAPAPAFDDDDIPF